jgi:hypothetical protein
MRALLFIFAMLLMLLLSGCCDLLSVQPLATAETTVFDAGLTGEWSCADTNCKRVGLLIRAGSTEKKDYDILWIPEDSEEVLRLKGQLVKVGDRLVFDLITRIRPDLMLPAHFFLLVEKTEDGVKFYWLDSKWLRDRVMSKDGLAHAMVDDKPVITAGSAEINAFLAKFGLDPQAVSDSLSFKRVKGQ